MAELLTAIVGALSLLGGGVAWLWRRVEKGFAEVKAELKACQEREAAATRRETALQLSFREQAAKHLLVIELLWQAASKSKASAPTLARCKQHLDDLKATTKELTER